MSNTKDKFTQRAVQQIQESLLLVWRDCDGKIPIADLGTSHALSWSQSNRGWLQQLSKELSGQGVSLVDFDGFLPLAARYFRSETEKELKGGISCLWQGWKKDMLMPGSLGTYWLRLESVLPRKKLTSSLGKQTQLPVKDQVWRLFEGVAN